MSFERFVASRYLLTKRKGLFAAVTTAIGVAGIAVGTATPIVVLSVMNGFQSDIQKKIIGAQAHVMVHGDLDDSMLKGLEKALARQPEVKAATPFVLSQAIVTYQGRSTGIVVRGLDPRREFQVNDLAKTLTQGGWDGLAPEGPKATPGIVLGEELAKLLGVWLGEEVVLVSPQGVSSAMGLLPKMKRFRVAGLLHTGYYEYDSSTAYLRLPEAASFFGVKGGASGMAARLSSLDQAEPVARRLQKDLGYGYVVRSFKDMNRTLFAALKLEKYVMFLIVTLIGLVAAFNIASNLILMTTEKLRDIGLLKSMGARPDQIRRIFVWEGLMMGGAGVALGLLLGLGLSWVIGRYPIVELPPDIYYLSRVPVHVAWEDVAAVLGSGLLLSLVATIYPASRAAKVDPVEAIRYG